MSAFGLLVFRRLCSGFWNLVHWLIKHRQVAIVMLPFSPEIVGQSLLLVVCQLLIEVIDDGLGFLLLLADRSRAIHVRLMLQSEVLNLLKDSWRVFNFRLRLLRLFFRLWRPH